MSELKQTLIDQALSNPKVQMLIGGGAVASSGADVAMATYNVFDIVMGVMGFSLLAMTIYHKRLQIRIDQRRLEGDQ
jgi:hypothetical protein